MISLQSLKIYFFTMQTFKELDFHFAVRVIDHG